MLSPSSRQTIIAVALLMTLHLSVSAPGASTGEPASAVRVRTTVAPTTAAGSGGSAAEGAPPRETLVVGFTLSGGDPWKKRAVSDLEIVVAGSGQRYLPLFRLLKVFEIERSSEGDLVSFLPEGMPNVVLNTALRTVEVDKVTRTIDLIQARSELSGETELFLAPETVAGLLGIVLAWNDDGYEFIGTTSRKLKIWRTSSRSSREIPLQDVPANLPEAHPQADPNRFSLDFLELTARASFLSDNNLHDKQGRLDNLQQNLWGSLLGGACRLSFAERDIQINNSYSQTGGNSPIMLTRAEWNQRYLHSEVSVGDSSFGLSELAFPGLRMTGVRVNGLAGRFDAENQRDSSSRGLRSYFVQSQVFAGSAPRGSQVELKINGRVHDTQEAVPAVDSEVGMGNYRFEDVILPPGSLNEILITITDTSGIKTQVKQEILGSSLFLPAGRFAYLGGVGTSRDLRTWQARGIFAGGRALYAFSDRLTAGYTLGLQEHLFDQFSFRTLGSDQRRFPDASLHMGGQVAWQPAKYLILGGEAALSRGSVEEHDAAYDDLALKTTFSLFPTRNSSLQGQFFRYGPDFFNGQNVELHDRQGYALRGKWQPAAGWSLNGLYASIANNLERAGPETLRLDFQNLEISSSALPHTTVSASVNRSLPSWEEPETLYVLKLYALLTPAVTVKGAVAGGGSLYLSGHSDFANGVNIAGLATEDLSSFASVAVVANQWHELGATYAKSIGQEKTFASHSYRGGGGALRMKTDAGYDFSARSPILKNRTEYLLDSFGEKSLEMVADYENRNLSLVVSLNLRGLFGFHEKVPSQVQSRYIQPDNGGVTGKVFIDYNANAGLDPGEPGLKNVKVIMGGSSCLTDKNGYFRLPNAGDILDARVFLDMDSVPAIYSPTHGQQKAHIMPGVLTEVNLGVTPLISLTGLVTGETAEHKSNPLYGVRVFITKPGEVKVLAESSTSGDGSYYLGDLRPGRYRLQVDRTTLPKNVDAAALERDIEIAAAREPQEIKVPDFELLYRKEAPQPAGASGPGAGGDVEHTDRGQRGGLKEGIGRFEVEPVDGRGSGSIPRDPVNWRRIPGGIIG
jgi:hypothetical protein